MFPRRVIAFSLLLTALNAASASTSTDSLGPVAPWRGRTVVDTGGVQAAAADYAPAAALPAWTPHWFMAREAGPASTVFLRRSLDVSAGARLQHAVFNVSGDRSYRVWVNGTLVLRGPDDPGTDVGETLRWTHQWLYNTVDVTPYLHAGSNIVTVQVVNSPLLSNPSLGTPGFAFASELTYEGGHTQASEGPDGWSGRVTDAYTQGTIGDLPDGDGLRYAAAKEPTDWPLPSDTTGWSPVEAIASPWGTLRPSRIPTRMEAVWPVASMSHTSGASVHVAELKRPAEDIRVTGDSAFTVDFGRVISAYLSMQIESDGGAIVTLVPRETHDQKEVARPVEVTLRKGVTTWESPGYDSFSQVEVRLSHVSAPVHVRFVRAVFTSQPVIYRGSFESSDDHLNALWKAARWQTQICLQDRFLDSPNHQEPIGDPGDYLIAAAQSDYAFGDPWMAAQNLRQFAALLDRNKEVTFHPSYPLYWVQMLREYYERTGDKALVVELAPSVDRLLAHLRTYIGANGLVSEAPNYMFMDWVDVEGYNLHHPPAVIGQGYFSALLYRGLNDGAAIARLAEHEDAARRYDQQAQTLKTAFESELWDAAAGLYRDGKPFQNHQPLAHYFPADRDIETHTDQVNLFAVLYGLAPDERAKAIMDKLSRHAPLKVQPYFMHFAFDAEAKTDDWNRLAWSQLQQWHLNAETGTFREMWFHGDWSHSWGGTPLVQLSSRVLGVTPASPGYAAVRIAPRSAGLAWAKGTVPTPHGPVQVAWRRAGHSALVTVSSPPRMPIVFDPTGLDVGSHQVSVDGTHRDMGDGASVSLAPGDHLIRVGDASDGIGGAP